MGSFTGNLVEKLVMLELKFLVIFTAFASAIPTDLTSIHSKTNSNDSTTIRYIYQKNTNGTHTNPWKHADGNMCWGNADVCSVPMLLVVASLPVMLLAVILYKISKNTCLDHSKCSKNHYWDGKSSSRPSNRLLEQVLAETHEREYHEKNDPR